MSEIKQTNIYMPKQEYYVPPAIISEDDNNLHGVDVYSNEYFYNQIKRNLMF